MKTAKQLLKENYLLIENDKTCECHTRLVEEQMIEFAKLHVKAALKAAAKNVKYTDEYESAIDKETILNSYSLNNIK